MVELGQLEAKVGEFEKRHIRILAISLDNLEESKETQTRFPHLVVVADFEKNLSEAVQVIHGDEGPGGATTDAPTTILVDGRGIVRWVFRPDRFLIRLNPQQLLQKIDEHMGGD